MVSIDKNIFYNEGLLKVVNIAEMKTLCNDAEKEKQKKMGVMIIAETPMSRRQMEEERTGAEVPFSSMNIVSCNADIFSTLQYCEKSCSGGLQSDNCTLNLHYASDPKVKTFFELVHKGNELNINCQHIYVALEDTPGLTITKDVRQSLVYRRARDAWEQIIQPTLKK